MTSQRHTPVAAVAEDPVLAAAYDAVLDLGVRRLTLAEVARRAGVSRMTVYRRYDDLAHLLSALLTTELTAAVADVVAGLASAPTARARAAAAVGAVTDRVAGHPLMCRVLELDPEALLPLVVARLGSSQRLARAQLAALVRAGQPAHGGDGSVRAGDADRLALAVVLAAQSFVFSARVVEAEDPAVRGELPALVDRYLAPDPPVPVPGGAR